MRAKGNETRAFKVELEKISYGSGVVWPRAQARLGAACFVGLGWLGERGGVGVGGPPSWRARRGCGGCGWWMGGRGRRPPERSTRRTTKRTTKGSRRLLSQASLCLCVCCAVLCSAVQCSAVLCCVPVSATPLPLPLLCHSSATASPPSAPKPALLPTCCRLTSLPSPAPLLSSCSCSPPLAPVLASSASGQFSSLLALAALHGPPFYPPTLPLNWPTPPPVALSTLSNLHHHRQRATTIRLTVPPLHFTSTTIFSSSFFPFPSLPYSYPPLPPLIH